MAKAFPNTGVTIIDSSSDLTGFSPSEGLMVFQKDTNELKIYDGSNWVSVVDTDTPNGLVHLGTQSFTSLGTSGLNFTNVFSLSFTNYMMLVYAGGVAAEFRLQLLNGTTPVSTNYNFSYFTFETTTSVNASSGMSYYYFGNSGTDYGGAVQVNIFSPFAANKTSFSSFGNQSSNYRQGIISSGAHTLATSYNGLSFFPSVAGITGNISLYGYRNSV